MREVQRLISLPAAPAKAFPSLERRPLPQWVAASDPGGPLGSAGGTAHLLADAWRRTGGGLSFVEWLRASPKLIVHSGGQSRRLPAYAAVGKALMPMPVLRGSVGQRPDQELIDVLIPAWERLFDRAHPSSRVLVASGDAFVRFDALPDRLPEADVVCVGIDGSPEDARDFGVFFARHDRPDELDFFLQKPDPETTLSLAGTHGFMLDTGVWLLGERAIANIMRRCGWDAETSRFRNERPDPYELYTEFGLSLGANPARPEGEAAGLDCKVVAASGDFYHFGTTRQLIEGVTRLHNQSHPRTSIGFLTSARRHPDQHLQNCTFARPHDFPPNLRVWIENAHIGAGWRLHGDHAITGAPKNNWHLDLREGVCLDFVPVGQANWCVRAYGFDDRFTGAVGDPRTLFLGEPVEKWLADRHLTPADLGCDPETDIQEAPLFPSQRDWDSRSIQWMWRADGRSDSRSRYLAARRLSARELPNEVNLERLYAQRKANLETSLMQMMRNHESSVFYHLDLEATAELLANTDLPPRVRDLSETAAPVKRIHHTMFVSAWKHGRGEAGWERDSRRAFAHLRDLLTDEVGLPPAQPRQAVQEDQIVWARAPLRFDLAGGWSDTPPYCLLHGGKVLNVAVNLNGQPPVQVFARLSSKPELVLRSIDLGTEARVRTYEDLLNTRDATSEFSLAKIALALAGFAPRFFGERHDSLHRQLEDFGGGIELSLVAAVPKGSGLGTSSILASTILGTLSDFCGLGWSYDEIFMRTLALEQILGTGGGWQDQAGGCLQGLKVLETRPGLDQRPICRRLPDRLLGPGYANGTVLLYYTGITRMAHSVLAEIVRGMFLNAGRRLDILRRIVENVGPLADAIQREDLKAFGASIRQSWELNQALDSGTNPPAVAAMLADIEDYVEGAKLLGAGGGGYLFIVAKDEEAARRIRSVMEQGRHSPKARFVDFSVSNVGLEVTRS